MKYLFSLLLSITSFLCFPHALSHEEMPHSAGTESMSASTTPSHTFSLVTTPLTRVLNNPICHISAEYPWQDSSTTEVFENALQKFPCELLQSLTLLEVVEDPDMPRALSGRSIVKLRSDVFTHPEIESLLLHEFAHVIDLGGLRGDPRAGKSIFQDGNLPIFENDISLKFYQISWKNELQKKEEMTAQEFVGGYAMTDPFEDFAESMLFYRIHGNTFRQLAKENRILQEKYNFFQTHIFDGEEFATGKKFANTAFRPWDITKLTD